MKLIQELVKDGKVYRIWREGSRYLLDFGRQKPVEIMIPEEVQDEKVIARLVDYVINSLSKQLLIYTVSNKSLMKLAYHLVFLSGSTGSLYQYITHIKRVLDYCGYKPDDFIKNYKSDVNNRQVVNFIKSFIVRGNSHSTAKLCIATFKTFLRVNGIESKLDSLMVWPRMRSRYASRAATKDEVRMMVNLAPNIRDRAIILCLATSGLRIGTLLSLRLRNIDLKAIREKKYPVLVTVPADLTKGKYATYHTFINKEAAEALRLYFEEREHGTIMPDDPFHRGIPPENLTSDSYLFVTYTDPPKKLSPRSWSGGAFRRILFKMQIPKQGKRHELTVRSLRKFFKTQMISKGIPEQAVDYMMGHVTDTYTRIQSLGIEWLREQYQKANLTIMSEELEDKKALKEYLRTLILQKGYDPEEFLKPWIILLSKDLLETPFDELDLSYSRIDEKVI